MSKINDKIRVHINRVELLCGVAAVGLASLTLLGNWAGEKQQEAKIAEKVAEAVSKSKES